MAATPTSSFSTPAPQKEYLLPPAPDPTSDKNPAQNLAFDKFDEDHVINQIVQVVSKHQSESGTSYDNNPEFNLREQRVYNKLLHTLEEHKLQEHFDSLRYRWTSRTGILTLFLMAPSSFHELISSQVAFEAGLQLRGIPAQYPDLEPFCGKLWFKGTSNVITRDQGFAHCPDGQWGYEPFETPSFVFEVAYSHSKANVFKVCQEYLDRFPNLLGGSLEFGFSYKPGTYRYTGSVFLIEAAVVEEGTLHHFLLTRKKFRVQGIPQEGSLKIPFRLFIPPHQRYLLPATAEEAAVHINFTVLNKWTEKAEH